MAWFINISEQYITSTRGQHISSQLHLSLINQTLIITVWTEFYCCMMSFTKVNSNQRSPEDKSIPSGPHITTVTQTARVAPSVLVNKRNGRKNHTSDYKCRRIHLKHHSKATDSSDYQWFPIHSLIDREQRYSWKSFVWEFKVTVVDETARLFPMCFTLSFPLFLRHGLHKQRKCRDVNNGFEMVRSLFLLFK